MNREKAIDIIRKNIPHLGIGAAEMTEALNELIPELRESEDEEIRKDIIGGLMWQRDNLKSEGPHDNNLILTGFCFTVGKHLTYLEKQKEQRLLSVSAASEWLRKHVCNYVNSEYNEFHKCVEYDGSIDKEKLINDFEKAMQKESLRDFIDDFPYSDQKERKPELVQHPPITFTYNSNASRDERLKAALLALLNSDLLKIKEGGYFTKQDLIEWVEQKPSWSEEDDKMLTGIIERGSSQVPFGATALRGEQMEWLMNLLKFHRQQLKKL